MFGNVFYRDYEYKMVTHARVFSLSFINNENRVSVGLFIASVIAKSIFGFGYENMCSWSKICGLRISLPQTPGGKIDFDFMEDFVAELEAQRVAELEAYLTATGLNNYHLTEKEKKVIDDFDSVRWGEYRLGDLFENLKLKFKKKLFNKNKDVSKEKTDEFSLPLVNAKNGDNGIMYYGRESDFESTELSIDIVNDGAVSTGNVYPQPQKTGVLYNAYLIKFIGKTMNSKLLQFMACTTQKSIKLKFNYENKAGWEKVKSEKILLPQTSDGKIDFDFMETFISAIQKLVIKSVVEYKDTLIQTTKEVLG